MQQDHGQPAAVAYVRKTLLVPGSIMFFEYTRFQYVELDFALLSVQSFGLFCARTRKSVNIPAHDPAQYTVAASNYLAKLVI